MRSKLIAAATAIALGSAMPTTATMAFGHGGGAGAFSLEAKASMVAAFEAATSVARECGAASEAIAVFPVISDMEDTVLVSVVMALANMAATEVINDGGLAIVHPRVRDEIAIATTLVIVGM